MRTRKRKVEGEIKSECEKLIQYKDSNIYLLYLKQIYQQIRKSKTKPTDTEILKVDIEIATALKKIKEPVKKPEDKTKPPDMTAVNDNVQKIIKLIIPDTPKTLTSEREKILQVVKLRTLYNNLAKEICEKYDSIYQSTLNPGTPAQIPKGGRRTRKKLSKSSNAIQSKHDE